MDQRIHALFTDLLGEESVLTNEPMSRHTTFRIGGPADCIVFPSKMEEIRSVVEICRAEGLQWYILGNGSNLLIGDSGFRGVFIQIGKNFSGISREGDHLRVQAGALLSAVARFALNEGLEGFEFASGIPGTLGGACVMNAGAYGGEIKDVAVQVTLLDRYGKLRVLTRDEMKFGYRESIVEGEGLIVLEAVLALRPGDPEVIRGRMEELKEKRTTKQPLDLPSAGSTFKRPKGYYAGKLIMDAGLAGYRVGGACVSPKHCGFVVNDAGASAADVRALMTDVIRIVDEKFGVTLEPEVKMLGEF